MRVAIVHDFLNQRGGAERVLAVMHEMFPDAPIYTSVLDRASLWPGLRSADIRVSWMQRLPGIKRHFKKYLLFYPLVFERLDLSGFDLVLSSSSAFAKAVRPPRGGAHVCYCHTPARFLWNYDQYVEREDLGRVTNAVLPWAIRTLRRWDLRTADRPTVYVANSSTVAGRIRRIYGREAVVVPPPVEWRAFAMLRMSRVTTTWYCPGSTPTSRFTSPSRPSIGSGFGCSSSATGHIGRRWNGWQGRPSSSWVTSTTGRS